MFNGVFSYIKGGDAFWEGYLTRVQWHPTTGFMTM